MLQESMCELYHVFHEEVVMRGDIIHLSEAKVTDTRDIVPEDKRPKDVSILPILLILAVSPTARCHALNNLKDLVEKL